MNHEDFMKLTDQRHERSKQILLQKAHEYSTPDGNRLEQFYKASEICGLPPTESLINMAVKHFTSIHNMSRNPSEYTLEEWDEKLIDLRNYTYLMDALVRDMRYGKGGEDA